MPIQKAGVIPFHIDGEEISMLFMVPSDPKFGGPSPQIAKGGIDRGEDAKAAAMREGSEELGLRPENVSAVLRVGSAVIHGQDEIQNLTIFATQISDPAAFNQPHYETGAVYWLTMDEFTKIGRKSQWSVVNKAHQTILRAIG